MSNPYLGEIRLTSFGFAPKGWALCNGQTLPINQNQALFALLGTTYGGDGQTTFLLPDLQGRIPLGASGAHPLGQTGGETAHVLTSSELPQHTHLASTTAVGTRSAPSGAYFAGPGKLAFGGTGTVPFAPGTVSNVGSGQPHENQAPFLTISFAIALQGIFPSRN
ncbi:phage tail protein [Leifsonia poae]|uniref:phage tail protein n=1 Tax=Leifsonia poae TaxID=110933 RepID=UPI001CBBFF3B|nr:tail fiber protein [Leifsonia poae]